MKINNLGLIHTSATLVPVFQELCKKHLPDVNTFNIVDDSLIKEVISKGKLTPETSRRVVNYIGSAELAGADFILVTCSSIGAAVEGSAPLTRPPVLRVDQPMADLAVKTGSRIGVVATLTTTLEPTSDLVGRRARFAGKQVEIISHLCDGAFDALMNGDIKKHDAMVTDALLKLSGEVEVIVLAQASMARVINTFPDHGKNVPILSSPGLAIKHIAALIKEK
jgi:Asp/Glu/hydantoin racemase